MSAHQVSPELRHGGEAKLISTARTEVGQPGGGGHDPRGAAAAWRTKQRTEAAAEEERGPEWKLGQSV